MAFKLLHYYIHRAYWGPLNVKTKRISEHKIFLKQLFNKIASSCASQLVLVNFPFISVLI